MLQLKFILVCVSFTLMKKEKFIPIIDINIYFYEI